MLSSYFNIKSGASALITILLMLIIVSVGAFGFILLISSMDEHTAAVNNDPTNFSGIDYTTGIYNNTNSTLHGLASTMPNFIWIVFIFLLIVFLTLLAIGLKRR
jgi:nitrate reductase NapE component